MRAAPRALAGEIFVMKKNKTALSIAAALLGAAALIACGGGNRDCGQRDAALVVGLSLFDLPSVGAHKHRAAELARDDINAACGNVSFIDGNLDEDFYAGRDPVEHLRDLVNNGGIAGLVGPTTSATAVRIHDFISERGLVAVSPTAASDHLSESLNKDRIDGGEQHYFFRTGPANSLQAHLLENLTAGDGDDVLVVYADDGPGGYGEDMARRIAAEMRLDGRPAPTLAGYPVFRFEDSDADGKAGTFVEEKIDTLPGIGETDSVIVAGFTEGGKVLRHLLESDRVPENARYYVSDGVAHGNLYPFLRKAGESLEDPGTLTRLQGLARNVRGVTPYPQSVTDCDAWRNRFPDATEFEDLLYSTHTYDAVVVMALAALKAESADPSVYASEVAGVTKGGTKCGSYAECRRLLLDGDSSNDDIDYDGISGPLEIDGTGDLGDAIFAVYTYDGRGGHSAVEEEVVKGRRDITVLPLSCVAER